VPTGKGPRKRLAPAIRVKHMTFKPAFKPKFWDRKGEFIVPARGIIVSFKKFGSSSVVVPARQLAAAIRILDGMKIAEYRDSAGNTVNVREMAKRFLKNNVLLTDALNSGKNGVFKPETAVEFFGVIEFYSRRHATGDQRKILGRIEAAMDELHKMANAKVEHMVMFGKTEMQTLVNMYMAGFEELLGKDSYGEFYGNFMKAKADENLDRTSMRSLYN